MSKRTHTGTILGHSPLAPGDTSDDVDAARNRPTLPSGVFAPVDLKRDGDPEEASEELDFPLHDDEPTGPFTNPPVEIIRAAQRESFADVLARSASSIGQRERLTMQQVSYFVTAFETNNPEHAKVFKQLSVEMEGKLLTRSVGRFTVCTIVFSRERPPFRVLRLMQEVNARNVRIPMFFHNGDRNVLTAEVIPPQLQALLDAGLAASHKTSEILLSWPAHVASSHSRVRSYVGYDVLAEVTISVSDGTRVPCYVVNNITSRLRDPDGTDFAAEKMYGRQPQFERITQSILSFARRDFSDSHPFSNLYIEGVPGSGKTEFINRVILWMKENVAKYPELFRVIPLKIPAVDADRNASFAYLRRQFLPSLLEKTKRSGLQHSPNEFKQLSTFIDSMDLSQDRALLECLQHYFSNLEPFVSFLFFDDDAHWIDMATSSCVLDPLFRSKLPNLLTVLLSRCGGVELVPNATLQSLGLGRADAVTMGPIQCYRSHESRSLNPEYIAMVNDILGKKLGIKIDPAFIIDESFLHELADRSKGVPGSICYPLMRLVEKGGIRLDDVGQPFLSDAFHDPAASVMDSIFSNQAADLLNEFPQSPQVLSVLLALEETGNCTLELISQIFGGDPKLCSIVDNLRERRTLTVSDGYVSFLTSDLSGHLRGLLDTTSHLRAAHATIAQYFHTQHRGVSAYAIYFHASQASLHEIQSQYVVAAFYEQIESLEFERAIGLYDEMRRLLSYEQFSNMDIHVKAVRALAATNQKRMIEIAEDIYDRYVQLMPSDKLSEQYNPEEQCGSFDGVPYENFTDENVRQLTELLDSVCNGYYMYINKAPSDRPDEKNARIQAMKIWSQRFAAMGSALHRARDEGVSITAVQYGQYGILQQYNHARALYREGEYDDADDEFMMTINTVENFSRDKREDLRGIADNILVAEKVAQAHRLRGIMAYMRRFSLAMRSHMKSVHSIVPERTEVIQARDTLLFELLGRQRLVHDRLQQADGHLESFLDQVRREPRICPDLREVFYAFQLRGRILSQMGMYQDALSAFLDARSIASKLRDMNGYHDIHMDMASMFGRMADAFLQLRQQLKDPSQALTPESSALLTEIGFVVQHFNLEQAGGDGSDCVPLDQQGVFLLHKALELIQSSSAYFAGKGGVHELIAAANAVEIGNFSCRHMKEYPDSSEALAGGFDHGAQGLDFLIQLVPEIQQEPDFQFSMALDIAKMIINSFDHDPKVAFSALERLRGPQGEYASMRHAHKALREEVAIMESLLRDYNAASPKITLALDVSVPEFLPHYIAKLREKELVLRSLLEQYIPLFEEEFARRS